MSKELTLQQVEDKIIQINDVEGKGILRIRGNSAADEQEIRNVGDNVNYYDKSKARIVGVTNQNITNSADLEANTDHYFRTNKTWTTVDLFDRQNKLKRSLGNTNTTKELQFTTSSDEVKAVLTFFRREKQH